MRALRVAVALLLMACEGPRRTPDAGAPFVLPCPTLPTSIDFGEVETGTTQRRDFGLSSIGNPTLGEVSEPFSVSFDSVVGFRRLSVSYGPMDGRSHMATLRLTPALGCPETEISLQGSGSGSLVVSHPQLDFGQLTQNQMLTRELMVTNTRRVPLEVSATAPNARWVTVQPTAFVLAPGASQMVTLTATFEFGEQFERLALNTAKDRLTVLLLMKGLSPRITLITEQSQPLASFVVPNFGAPEAVRRNVDVRNFGSNDLSVTAADVTPAGPTVVHPFPVVLMPTEEARLSVEFPTTLPPGFYEFSLRVSSDDPVRPDAGLSFLVESRVLSQCGALAFPQTVQVGDGGAFVTIANPGGASCLLDDVHVVNGFVQAPEQILLAPAASITLPLSGPPGTRLRFRPMRVGSTFEEITLTQ